MDECQLVSIQGSRCQKCPGSQEGVQVDILDSNPSQPSFKVYQEGQGLIKT